jgi:hypothetical protein
MPQIGELAPGVWLASGFGGHGLNTTALAGNLIARAIVEGDDTWKRFTPFELVWAGGVFARGITQIYYWAARWREALAERRARAATLAAKRGAAIESAAGGEVTSFGAEAAPEQDTGDSIIPPAAAGEPVVTAAGKPAQ